MRDTDPPFCTPAVPDPCTQAWWHLIGHAAPQDKIFSLFEEILSSEKITEVIDGLQGEHIQTFIDVIDAVCHQTRLPLENDN